ncbi:MAG: flavodoxin family protein [bacterium]|nr:MAG: flavodoxin family protein [bacterium]
MKVLGINASPRKGANTATLVETALKGAAGKGAETKMVNLNELDMKPCIGCDACKENLGHCVQKDDLTPLMEEMATFDAIVLGTPVYWFHVSAQFKTLVDRLYCYYGFEMDPETNDYKEILAFPAGKKVVFVTSRGDPEEKKDYDVYYGYMNEWLKVVGMALLASSVEFIHHYGSWNEKDAARKDAELLARAESVGASMI